MNVVGHLKQALRTHCPMGAAVGTGAPNRNNIGSLTVKQCLEQCQPHSACSLSRDLSTAESSVHFSALGFDLCEASESVDHTVAPATIS